jgi:hypothetical protein
MVGERERGGRSMIIYVKYESRIANYSFRNILTNEIMRSDISS